MSGIRLGLIVRCVALALMASALLVIGCRNAPVTMTKEPSPPPPATPDPNAGIAWRLVRTGGGLKSPSTTTRDQLRSVAWGAGRFVAVGLNGTIAHSADGSAWTEASATASEDHLLGVAWGSGRFVAVSHRGTVVHSADGTSWQSASEDAADGRGLYAVRSADGDAWEKVRDLSIAGYLSDAVYGNGRFVAVSGGTIIYSDDDGATWKEVSAPTTQPLGAVAWNGTRSSPSATTARSSPARNQNFLMLATP